MKKVTDIRCRYIQKGIEQSEFRESNYNRIRETN